MTAGFHKSLPAEAENHRLFYAKMTVNVPQTKECKTLSGNLKKRENKAESTRALEKS